jgi:tetratricopeptide (TPR) repeat protein
MLPEVLLNLAGKGQSGVFRAQKASVKKQLVLKNGDIAFAESSLPDEHLARIMIAMGFLKQSDLNEVVSLMKAGKNSEEAVSALFGSGGEAVVHGMREQVIVVLSSLLGWNNFDMQFFPGEDLIKNRTNTGLEIPEMLAFSARRAVSKRLVSFPPELLEGTITASRKRIPNRKKYPLDETESYAYVRALDKISAKELLPLLSTGDVAPEEVLLRLYVLGLIETEAPRKNLSFGVSESADSDEFISSIEDMLLRFETASLYEVLSIGTDAGPDEIQAAYHDLAKRFHPDRFQSEEVPVRVREGVGRIFACINKAYMILRNPAERTGYDETRLTKESEVEAAIKAKASSDAEDEKMIEGVFLQGRKSLADGDFEKAAKELKSCVYMRPDKAKYNHYLGLAELEIPGLHKSAEQHLLKAIELGSMSSDGYIALIKLYLKVNLRRKAAGLLEELMRLDSDNPETKKLFEEMKKLNPYS